MYKKKSLFIVFEGIEGCGKSYQSKKLYNSLKRIGLSTVLTREPGGTKSAEKIRNVILGDYFASDSKEKFSKYTDTLLYLAAMNEHVHNIIKPALSKNRIVICDKLNDPIKKKNIASVKGKKIIKINEIFKHDDLH